ncbi:phage tail sheath C-terminal domain-containing protein [Pleionea sp. CnH1-48]|uniref:phage tail sheath C-terminal domain-containing protein n=1 Tax=Pleionea sp. CnH1-48 TaxID=2954494 RepID=UPI002097B05F|nr:phage tail sheath C-terminal domain-containing protein [Pleionea sp. CnH1-48]MCO7223331.1 phage tail sheath subtilisin-like domain-containing protein [Pleionea sp. CnH1-48]
MPAPGVYLQATTTAAESFDIRTDQAALVGYAERGPAFVATRVNSYAEFVEVFGEYKVAYLTASAKSYFDNGGQVLYVIRVVAGSAQTAKVDWHHFRCFAAAPYFVGPGVEAQKNAQRKYDEVELAGTRHFYRLQSPGVWGNDLAVELRLNHPSKLVVQQWEPQLKRARLSSVAGIEAGSLLNISELYDAMSDTDPQWVRVVAVDAARQQVTLQKLPPALEAKDCSGESVFVVEMQALVYFRRQQIESFERLALHSQHSRYFVELINQNSRFIALNEPDVIEDDWNWLATLADTYTLEGGQLNMADLLVSDFERGIAQVEHERNIALLATPDLVYQQPLQAEEIPRFIDNNICQHLLPKARGRLQGRVLNEANQSSIAFARVILRASLPDGTLLMFEAKTDAIGQFYLEGLPDGNATVSIESSAYELEEFSVTIEAFGRLTEEVFGLTPIDLPPAFDQEDILRLQLQLIEQAEKLRNHYILLDTPPIANKLDEVLNWRFQLESKYASLIYPWLKFGHAEDDREQPASALVMGALAQTDLDKGLHYSSANLPLVTHGQLKHSITDIDHERLNEANINGLLVKPGEHVHLMGARTLSFEREWRYITSSRLLMFIIRFLEQRMQWVTFEPNSDLLRIAVRTKLTSLMQHLWRKGALAGHTPQQAFSVVCDETNNTEATRDQGLMIAEIGIAPTEPNEFIWLVYQRNADRSTVEVS